jgi:hypothetical protein
MDVIVLKILPYGNRTTRCRTDHSTDLSYSHVAAGDRESAQCITLYLEQSRPHPYAIGVRIYFHFRHAVSERKLGTALDGGTLQSWQVYLHLFE